MRVVLGGRGLQRTREGREANGVLARVGEVLAERLFFKHDLSWIVLSVRARWGRQGRVC